MKRIISLLLLSIFLLSGVAYASNVTNAKYLTTVTFTNNGTALSNAIGVFDLSTQDMIDAGMLNSSANNTAMLTGTGGSDVAFMPSANSSYPWIAWLSSIGASSSVNRYLYSADVTGGKIVYFPGSTGMTINDDATMEPSDNFSVELSGWFDTSYASANQTYIDKPQAFKVWNSAANTINASIGTGGLSFIGTGEVAATSAFGDVDFKSQAFTIDFYTWFDAASANETLIGIKPSTATKFGVGIFKSTTNKLGVIWQRADSGSTGRVIVSTDQYTFTTNRLYHIVVRYDGDGAPDAESVSIIVDGITRTDAAAGTFPFTWAAGTNYVQFANFDDTNKLDGDMGHVIIYSDNTSTVKKGDWSFYEGNGTVLSDTEGNDGTIVNGTWVFLDLGSVTASGISSGDYTVKVEARANSDNWSTGNTLKFDGTANSNINMGAVYNSSAKWWMSFWFRPTATFTAASAQQIMMGKFNGAGDYFQIALRNGDGKMEFRYVGVVLLSSQTSWTAGTAYHVIVSFSDVNGKRLRINGGTAVTNADAGTMPAAANLVFGNRTTGSTGGFQGEIFNVIIGTDDLTPAEEVALYNGVAPGDETEYLYIDSGTGTEIKSYGSTATTGTAGAATAWITATHTSGKTGRLNDYYIAVDGQNYGGTNLKGTSVPDNSNNWIIGYGGSALKYMDTFSLTKGGIERCNLSWEYGTTFTDATGNGNDGTPSFRTTASDADLSATIASQTGLVTASTPTSNLTGGATMILGTLGTPGNLFTEGGDSYKVGGFDIGSKITDTATEAGQDATTWHILVAFTLATLAFFGVYAKTHNARMGQRGSLLLASVAAEGVLILFYIYTTIPGWSLIPFGIISVLMVMWRKSPAPLD